MRDRQINIRVTAEKEDQLIEYAKRRGLYHGATPSKGAAIRELAEIGLLVVTAQGDDNDDD